VLTIDLVQYYEGSQAIREAARDGQTLEPDIDPVIYVRNENPKLRHLGVKLDAQVLMFDCATPGCPPKAVLLEDLPWNEMYGFSAERPDHLHRVAVHTVEFRRIRKNRPTERSLFAAV
jgi:hypothetical protein